MTFFNRSIASTLAAASALAFVLGTLPARADEGDGPDGGPDPGVARLSILNGNVDVKRGDSGETVAAAVNAPVSAGDYVTTHGDARAEIQYGYGAAVRVAPDTQLRFTHLDPNDHALQLAEGTVEMRVFRGLDAHPEVDTPSATIRPDEKGQYRVTVTNDGNTQVTVRSGRADVVTQGGTQTIASNSTLLIEGQGNDVRFQTIDTVAMDGFDEWNSQRDGTFEQAGDVAYADQGIVGADDLDQYGHWVDEPTYGRVWTPYEAADWSPYHDGRWVWEDYYGWTWIGDEPWGYAPYHYGNWFYASNRWCWYPGAYSAARVYRPALVGFFSFGFGGGGFNIGFGNIGWVPLAPFEPFRPWWGRRGFDRTTVVNIHVTNVTINNYRNLRVPNAAVAVTNANFANGNFKRLVPLREPELKTITAVRGVLPVVPTQHNLVLNPRANATTAAPLSPRFANFRQPNSVRPPSFDTQRETVAATAQKLYPEHASAIARPQSIPGAAQNGLVPGRGVTAERATAPTERAATPAEREIGNASNRGQANAPSERDASAGHDPWSRFGGGSNATTRVDNPARESTGSPTAVNHATGATNESARPASTPATNGGAWRRFNGGANGSPSGNTSSGSSASGNGYGNSDSRRRYDQGGGPSYSTTPSRTSTSRNSDSGSTYESAPASHQSPTYRQTPSYHQTPSDRQAPSYHQTPSDRQAPSYRQAPAAHQAPAHQAPAASGGNGSHSHDSPSKGSDDKSGHDGDRHGH